MPITVSIVALKNKVPCDATKGHRCNYSPAPHGQPHCCPEEHAERHMLPP